MMTFFVIGIFGIFVSIFIFNSILSEIEVNCLLIVVLLYNIHKGKRRTMNFDTTAPTNNDKERKPYDRSKTDDLHISRTDMNMLIMNYLVTGQCFQ